jgi:hypothetical protein
MAYIPDSITAMEKFFVRRLKNLFVFQGYFQDLYWMGTWFVRLTLLSFVVTRILTTCMNIKIYRYLEKSLSRICLAVRSRVSS